MKGMGQDSKYFSSTKKGEVSELRVELAATDVDMMKVRAARSPLLSPRLLRCSHAAGNVLPLPPAAAHPTPTRAQDAVKKVIAAITVGKDMSALFPDVVNCMRTGA
jgi:hypothetical protein